MNADSRDDREIGGAIAQRFEVDQPGGSASLDEYIDVILGDMAQSGELPADRDQAVAGLKRDLNARIVQAIIAALPPEASTELSRRLNQPDASVSSIHQFLLDSGIDIAGITRQTMLGYPAERPSGPFSPGKENQL